MTGKIPVEARHVRVGRRKRRPQVLYRSEGTLRLNTVPWSSVHSAAQPDSYSTGSVAVSFVIHTFYNATLLGGLFFSTGFFRHMERLNH